MSNPELPGNTSPSRIHLATRNLTLTPQSFTVRSQPTPTPTQPPSGFSRSGIEGHAVQGVAEHVNDDGTLLCEAQSPGQSGWRWTVEVMRVTWQEAVH